MRCWWWYNNKFPFTEVRDPDSCAVRYCCCLSSDDVVHRHMPPFLSCVWAADPSCGTVTTSTHTLLSLSLPFSHIALLAYAAPISRDCLSPGLLQHPPIRRWPRGCGHHRTRRIAEARRDGGGTAKHRTSTSPLLLLLLLLGVVLARRTSYGNLHWKRKNTPKRSRRERCGGVVCVFVTVMVESTLQ